MKTINLLFIFLIIAFTSNAQVEEGELFMSAGTYNSLSITLPDGSQDMVEKSWKNFSKKYGKTKRNKKTDEHFTDNATIPGMSANTVDLYVKFQGNRMTAWFDLGGAYLSSFEHGDAYSVGVQILQEFALDLKVQLVSEELENEEDKFENFTNDLRKLEKEKAKLETDIEEWKQKIAEAEQAIQKNIGDQDQMKQNIENQRIIVEQVKARLNALKTQ